jgi:glycosyltransferase involved in cell wall biosynthesis
VVPVLNVVEHLPRLLERLLEPGREARDRADEVLIVDGGSRDASASLARAAGARVIPSPPGRGLQLARGAESAAGEILLFLHADCVPGEDALEALREAFEQPGVELVAMRQRIEADHGFYRLVERAANARARRGMIYGDIGLALRSGLYRRHLPLLSTITKSASRPVSAAHCCHWRRSSFLAQRTRPPKSAAKYP